MRRFATPHGAHDGQETQSDGRKKAVNPAGLLDNALAQSIKESAQQIWLAGMGAFAKAQAEGTQGFDKLIKDGINLQKKTQGAAEDKISEVTGKMTRDGRRGHRQGRSALGQARVDLRGAHRQGDEPPGCAERARTWPH